MSYEEVYGLPPDFVPSEQLLNVTSSFGDMQVTLHEIDEYFKLQIQSSIIFGVRIGAAALAMLALFIVSRNRKTPVFILNQVCLFFVLLHSALYLGYILGGYSTITFQLTQFPELISAADKNVSNAASFMAFFLRLFIEASLVFQVRTMFQNPSSKKNYGTIIVGVTIATALALVGLDLHNCIKMVVISEGNGNDAYESRAFDAVQILFTSSINFMSVLLIVKLILAIKSRRYLGLKQFDGFHILLIMTTQTMFIPSIILIISYAVNEWESIPLPALSTLLVALSLPLSSMWAASANNAPAPTSTGSYTFSPTSYKGSSFFSADKTIKGDAYSEKIDDFYHSGLCTPSAAAAEEEAKQHWYNDDDIATNDDDGQFVSRTVHEISSR